MPSINVRPQSASGGLRYTDEEFRTAAKRCFGEPGVSVSQWGSVQRCEGGAFVELMAWIPDNEAEAIRLEREFNNRGRSEHSTR